MMTSRAESAADDFSPRLAAVRARLLPPMPGSAFWGWVGPLLVTAFGAFLRFDRLGTPSSVIFDETYYVPDALGILKYGVEHNYVGANARDAMLAHGNPHIFTSGGEFVAHPPLGKVFIAAGEWLFGLTPFGWRFAVAVVGSLSILMIARIGRRMTRSTLLGCVAGLLLALDGLEFVMSRTALLDIFVMFWVLAAFGALVVDRDVSRAAVVAEAAQRPSADALDSAGGPAGGAAYRPRFRWWRLAAGIFLGLACASKWNGIWYIPAFAAMSMAWDIGARHVAGVAARSGRALRREAAALVGSFAVAPAVAYVASWSGWFASSIGYDRNWAAQHGIHTPVISDLVSLFQYHKEMLAFNVGLNAYHPYRSEPWTWLTLARPVSYYFVCHPPAGSTCGATGSKVSEVLAIGTPLLWWSSIIALLVCVGWWLTRRDWRAGAVLLGVAAGWLPWFAFAGRTQFYFYSVAFDPYLVLAITLCLGLLLGPANANVRRRVAGSALVGVYLLVILADFAYMYPVLSAQVMSYSDWLSRMWYSPGGHGWI